MKIIYFGIEIEDDEKLTKENYINYYQQKNRNFSLEEIIYNYEKNFNYFKGLSREDFENEIKKFLNKFKKFKQITNLEECNCDGFYLMILDEYKQVYIGIADNIKKRILQHWKSNPHRLIYGNKDNSKLSIDAFKALDTSRIFIYHNETFNNTKNLINQINSNLYPNYPMLKNVTDLMENDEAKMIKYFNNIFTCNRYIRLKILHLYRDFK